MSVPDRLANLVGRWRGTNRLWVSPAEPVRESGTTMIVALAAQGAFLTFKYTWADEGAPQDGLLVVGHDPNPNTVKAFWIDSWHMRDSFMQCQGTLEVQGDVTLKGSYAAPPGPDWGWQINISPQSGSAFQILMHNISPDGEAALAVEATYARQP